MPSASLRRTGQDPVLASTYWQYRVRPHAVRSITPVTTSVYAPRPLVTTPDTTGATDTTTGSFNPGNLPDGLQVNYTNDLSDMIPSVNLRTALSEAGEERPFGSSAIPLRDSAVDSVVCIHVLEHVADDPKQRRVPVFNFD